MFATFPKGFSQVASSQMYNFPSGNKYVLAAALGPQPFLAHPSRSAWPPPTLQPAAPQRP